LFLSGQVDDRTIQKYEKEAKDKSRESWWVGHEQYLACVFFFCKANPYILNMKVMTVH
jgi:hypothetical protein